MRDLLKQIDAFFEEKMTTPFERGMAFALIAVIFAVASRPLIPVAESMASFQEGENKALSKEGGGGEGLPRFDHGQRRQDLLHQEKQRRASASR